MTQYTKRPTNPCCSPLDVFRSDKVLYDGPLGYTDTYNISREPFKTDLGQLQGLRPNAPGMMQPQRNQPLVQYQSDLFLKEMPRGGVHDACFHPPPQIQWYKYGGTGYKARTKK